MFFVEPEHIGGALEMRRAGAPVDRLLVTQDDPPSLVFGRGVIDGRGVRLRSFTGSGRVGVSEFAFPVGEPERARHAEISGDLFGFVEFQLPVAGKKARDGRFVDPERLGDVGAGLRGIAPQRFLYPFDV